MKISLLYGTEAVTLPGLAAEKLDRASKRDIKVLFALAQDPAARNDTSLISSKLGITDAETDASLAFWRGAGILTECGNEDEKEEEKEKEKSPAVAEAPVKKPKKTVEAAEIPDYTTDELNRFLEDNNEIRLLIDECERSLGKIFAVSDIKTFCGICRNFGFDAEYVLQLCDYCKSIGKTALPYIYKTAFALYDEGITTVEALRDRVAALKEAATLENDIRKLFGMKSREFTSKERKFLTEWAGYGYGIDIIRKAYDMTVDQIHDPSIPYVNAIITRWHSEGLNTLEEIEADAKAKQPASGSFDTKEFFELAMKRSFRDDGAPVEPAGKNEKN